MNGRPVIGICTAHERARWSVWDQQAALLPTSYIAAVQRAGGMALLLAPDRHLIEQPDDVLDLLDGLMLAGGVDVDPATYGAEPHPETTDVDPYRDAFELALARRALERDIPFLGICRGMQLMNVSHGGTLRQHLPEDFGHHEHRKAIGTFDGADHDVRLVPGSLAARAAGEEVHGTKSHHHQGVGLVGDGLVVTGWSEGDELPEAIELPGNQFALGVQWHPEADERSGLIAALIDEAREHRAAASASADGAGAQRDGDGDATGAASPARAR